MHILVAKVTFHCSCLMNLEIKSTIFPSKMCWRRRIKYSGGHCGQKMTTVKQGNLCFGARPPDYRAASFLGTPQPQHRTIKMVLIL